jgi:hypothetical protein
LVATKQPLSKVTLTCLTLLPAPAGRGAIAPDALLGVSGVNITSVAEAATGLIIHVETGPASLRRWTGRQRHGTQDHRGDLVRRRVHWSADGDLHRDTQHLSFPPQGGCRTLLSPALRFIQARALVVPGGLAGNVAVSVIRPVPNESKAWLWVLAWVSIPTMCMCSSAMMVISVSPFPWAGGSAGPGSVTPRQFSSGVTARRLRRGRTTFY